MTLAVDNDVAQTQHKKPVGFVHVGSHAAGVPHLEDHAEPALQRFCQRCLFDSTILITVVQATVVSNGLGPVSKGESSYRYY